MEQFARDFGYLDKFLVNVAKHAETLPADRRDRLKQLMAEETARWEEVKRLLAGGSPAAGAPATAGAPGAQAGAPRGSGAASMDSTAAKETVAVPVAPTGLTIGSLLGVPKK